MKKMAKVAALLAAMVLAAGLTACQGKESSKRLLMLGAIVGNYTPDVPAKLSIPKGTTGIYEDAFRDCLKLVSVNIPDTVTKIGEFAFQDCMNLASVTIGNGVTYIGGSAFESCESLKEVKYAGTKAQWEEALTDRDGDRREIGNLVVHCKDGDITETLED